MKISPTATAAAAMAIYIIGGIGILGGFVMMLFRGGGNFSGLELLVMISGLGFSVIGVILMRLSRNGYGRESSRR